MATTNAKDTAEYNRTLEINHFMDRTDWRAKQRHTFESRDELTRAQINYPTGKGAPDSVYNGRVKLRA